jgi:predicted alpha/beta-hydrolase family hydrolase
MTTDSRVEPFEDLQSDPPVRGYLHRPSNSGGGALVLTHGAGSNCRAPLLVAMARAFSQGGYTVLRCDLPFRQAAAFGPPVGDAARDREGLRCAADALRQISPGRLYLGGHSYGGRQATMICSSQPKLADGLLLFSYPLHPPRKPLLLRTQHFLNLRTPSLFIHGTRDPFGSVEEMKTAVKLIIAKTRVMPVEGAGHDLDFSKKNKTAGANENLPEVVLGAFQEFFG